MFVLMISVNMFASKWTPAFRVGYDFNSELVRDNVAENIDSNIAIIGELATPFNDYIDIGVGVTFQIPRKYQNDKTFNFNPLYCLAKITPITFKAGTTSAIFRYGYNLFSGNREFKEQNDLYGGAYYSSGIDIRFLEKYSFEVSYNHHEGKRQTSLTGQYKESFTYKLIRVCIGMYF